MSLRPKTLRRLGIILGVVLLLVGVGTGLYLRNEYKKQKRLEALRNAGIASFEAGDYGEALNALKHYVGKVPSDTEAMYAYGTSRFRYEESDDHAREAKNALLMVLQFDPNHVKTKRTLLELYTKKGLTTEAVDLADQLLKQDANDTAALCAKAVALDRLHKFNEALEVSLKVNALEPLDIDQQLHSYELMRKLGKPPELLLDRAQKQQQANPNDPRFEMILAMAYRHAGDAEKSRQVLQQAATRPAPDANFVQQLVRLLDKWQLFSDADAVLQRAASSNDPKVLRILVQRLWQGNRQQEVIERLADLKPDHPDSDPHLLGLKALSLHELGRSAEAEPIIGALSRRKEDAQALAWSIALKARLAPSNPENPRGAVSQYYSAVSRAPDNAVIRDMLGDAYHRLGENDLAIGVWRRAADLAPSWPRPRMQIALALASANRFNDAIVEAKAAVKCAPDQVEPAATLAAIRFQQLEQTPDDAPGAKALWDVVEQIQKAAPGEPQSLPAYVSLLARNKQREQAIDALKAVLAKPELYGPSVFLHLAGVSQKEKLGLENDLLALAARDGETPRTVFARAVELAAAGKTDEGLALLEAKARSATTQPVQWRLAICQYREQTRDPAAAAQWIELGEAHPKDLLVQSTVLKTAASARAADRAFIGRTIDRLKELTGPEALTWRIERARWLIASENKEKDSADAVNTLNEVVRAAPALPEPHLLLALAYENVGNLPAATKELQIAAELQPASAAIALDAAHLLQLQFRFADARAYIEKVAAMRDLAPELRRRAAAMLVQQGDNGAAKKVLESAATKLDIEGKLLLADLYRRAERAADAQKIYDALLETKPPHVNVIRAAAAFFARQNRERSAQILSMLDQAKLRPGERELTRAEFEERFGASTAAEGGYRAATRAAPEDPAVWSALIAYHLRRQNLPQAQQAADEALVRLPKSKELGSLKSIAAAVASSIDGPIDLRPLADTFAANPDHPATTSLIAAVSGAKAKNLAPADALAAARKVVEQHPRFPAFQLALVQWCMKHNQIDEAAKIVARAMQQFPANPDAPRLATAVYRAARQWDLMAAAAARWRERTFDNPRPADLALAQARLNLADAPGALKALSPYLQSNLDPASDAELISTAARAYAAANRAADAEKLLDPLLSADPSCRDLWLSIVASDLASADAARKWIDRVTPLIPADASDQFNLASSCYTAAQRLKDKSLCRKAIPILDSLIARPDPGYAPFALRGLIAEEDGDYKLAESHYRRSLELNPKQPESLNNLAYLVLLRSGDLAEAKKLADQAIALAPQVPEFHDTLARIHARAGATDAAIESFHKALKLDPNNLHALIGLAATYTAAGKKDSAAPLVNQIDILLKARPTLTPALRQELDSVRTTFKAASID